MTYKLICFDMEGVIFRQMNFWMELHKEFGTYKQGVALTERLLHSDYDKLVQEVVGKLWKGKDAGPYYNLIENREYMPGVKETFKYVRNKGLLTVIISGASLDVARRAQKDLSIDHIYANELVIKEGKVSGEFLWPIGAGNEKKAEILKHLCYDLGIKLSECICVADDKTNVKLFKEAGLSIAFNSDSEELKKAATHIVDSNNLADILKYLPK